MTILSVINERRNGPLIAAAASLWIKPDDLVVDVTYGRGRFWTDYRPANLVCHDIDPRLGDGVDFCELPEDDESVDVVVFDPPYISVGGRNTSTVPDMLDRYGLEDAPTSPEELSELIACGISEAHRVLKRGGKLFLKTADYVTSGRYYPGHFYALNFALMPLGRDLPMYEMVDEFVHFSGTGPQPLTNRDGTPRRQIHSRRAHSFLTIFKRL